MEKYLSDPLWLLGAFGWIVGVISGFLQVKSYLDQKKYENAHKVILDQAERDWKGKYTQEQIDSMVQEIKNLEESINRDVPLKARRVFLQDQLSTLADNLGQSFTLYTKIVSELGVDEQKLPDQVQKAIEKEIMPQYLERKKQEKQILGVLGLVVVFNFFMNLRSVLLFLPRGITFDKFGIYGKGDIPAGWVWLFIIASICFLLTTNYLFENKISSISKKTKTALTLIIAIYGIPAIYLCWHLIAHLDNYSYQDVQNNGIPNFVSLSLVFASILSSYIFLIAYNAWRNKRNRASPSAI